MPPARRSARTASSTIARDPAAPYSTRANRQPSPRSSRPTASITRGANGSSLKLKVKAPSSKLKQVTGAGDGAIPPNPYADLSESDATPQPATRTARQTRNPRTVVEPDTDEDEEMEDAEGDQLDDGDEMEEDDEGEDDEDAEEDSEEDADAEEDDEDDEPTSDPIPPPVIRQEYPPGNSKPNVTVTAPPEGPIKSVEAKEMEDEEDEDLSDLDSNPDADADDDEVDDDESDEDPDNSRSATPDLTKLTKRQRGAVVEADPVELMELSNEAQKKKHLTAEEQVMRRAEMARRRKNLSEKRNEEEKMDTINKLLKKPAPKRRTRAEIIAQQQAEMLATPAAEEGEEERPDPLFVRWVSGANSSRVGVPEEWMESAVGEVFRAGGNDGGQLVEEVA